VASIVTLKVFKIFFHFIKFNRLKA